MSAFEIGPVRELLGRDLEMFVAAFERRLPELVLGSRDPVAAEELARHAHSLKGLAATLNATGLAQWGEDLERLLKSARVWSETLPDRAIQLYQRLLDRIPAWREMNALTLEERLDEAAILHGQLYWDLVAHFAEGLVETVGPATELLAVRTPSLIRRATHPPVPATTHDGPRSGQLATVEPLAVITPPLRASGAGKHSSTIPEAVPAPTPAVAAGEVQLLAVATPELRGRSDTSSARFSGPAAAPVLPPVPAPPSIPALTPTPPSESAPAEAPQPASAHRAAAQLPSVVLPPLRAAAPSKKRSLSGVIGLTPATPPPVPVSAPFAEVLPIPSTVPSARPVAAATDDLAGILRDEVAVYLRDLSKTLNSLVDEVEAVDRWEEVRRLFHTIKGSAATCGLGEVAGLAKSAEARCLGACADRTQRSRDSLEICLQQCEEIARRLSLTFDAAPIATRLSGMVPGPLPAEPASDPAPDSALLGYFLTDAGEQVNALEQAVLRWERQEENEQQISTSRRAYHTIKGAANSIGLRQMGAAVHEAESFLAGFGGDAGQAPAPAVFQWLLRSVDQIRDYLRSLSSNPGAGWTADWRTELAPFHGAGGAGRPAAAVEANELEFPAAKEPESTAPNEDILPTATDEDSQSIRIDSARLYQLINLTGELVADRSRLEWKMEKLSALLAAARERNRAMSDHVSQFQREFEFNLLRDRGSAPVLAPGGMSDPGSVEENARKTGALHGEFSELEFDRYDQFSILARQLMEIAGDQAELYEELSQAAGSFTADNTAFRETSQQLQKRVINLSMVPLADLQPRLLRAFRDAAAVEHKEAQLRFEGEPVTVDKSVADRLYPPLLHLLRNAVSHGIEPAGARTAAGKPAAGVVTFRAIQAANQVVISITDDGRGIDLEAVRRRAVAKGWVASDVPLPTLEQATQWIFQPGFSTVDQVTEISGRGVGLDIVRQEIQSLNGTVELSSHPGGGTIWTLRVPVTLAITEAIFAVAGEQSYALPLNYVESGLVLESGLITRNADGSETYLANQELLPLIRLTEVLGRPSNREIKQGVLVSAGDTRIILGVDQVLGRQEIVIKQLDDLMAGHPLLGGATLDIDGRVIVVLNIPNLLRFATRSNWRHSGSSEPALPMVAVKRRQRVLIVDDSLSVRKVQERLLRGLDCEVVAAADGLEALEQMRLGEFDLICSDLEMPRMNGYELIAELHTHPVWGRVPIVVISSRSADKYIAKAMNLGARTFLAKPFTEHQLSQVLRQYTKWQG